MFLILRLFNLRAIYFFTTLLFYPECSILMKLRLIAMIKKRKFDYQIRMHTLRLRVIRNHLQ